MVLGATARALAAPLARMRHQGMRLSVAEAGRDRGHGRPGRPFSLRWSTARQFPGSISTCSGSTISRKRNCKTASESSPPNSWIKRRVFWELQGARNPKVDKGLATNSVAHLVPMCKFIQNQNHTFSPFLDPRASPQLWTRFTKPRRAPKTCDLQLPADPVKRDMLLPPSAA